MEIKRFTHINQGFTCLYCGELVPPLSKGCRNHCPFCLSSQHLDHHPGDRSVDCAGEMRAISYQVDSKKGVVLYFQCQACQTIKKNRAALEDTLQADNYSKILQLSSLQSH